MLNKKKNPHKIIDLEIIKDILIVKLKTIQLMNKYCYSKKKIYNIRHRLPTDSGRESLLNLKREAKVQTLTPVKARFIVNILDSTDLEFITVKKVTTALNAKFVVDPQIKYSTVYKFIKTSTDFTWRKASTRSTNLKRSVN